MAWHYTDGVEAAKTHECKVANPSPYSENLVSAVCAARSLMHPAADILPPQVIDVANSRQQAAKWMGLSQLTCLDPTLWTSVEAVLAHSPKQLQGKKQSSSHSYSCADIDDIDERTNDKLTSINFCLLFVNDRCTLNPCKRY